MHFLFVFVYDLMSSCVSGRETAQPCASFRVGAIPGWKFQPTLQQSCNNILHKFHLVCHVAVHIFCDSSMMLRCSTRSWALDVCPRVSQILHVILPHPHSNYGIGNGCMAFAAPTAVLSCCTDMKVAYNRKNNLRKWQMCDAKCTASQAKP